MAEIRWKSNSMLSFLHFYFHLSTSSLPRDLEFYSRSDGVKSKELSSVNWDELGDSLVAHLLTEGQELHLATAAEPSTKSSTTWQYLYTKDGVDVFQKKTQDVCYAGQGVLEVPLHQVADLVKDIESSFLWEKYLVEANCVRVLSASESKLNYIGYEKFQTSGLCLYKIKRDMLYFNTCVYKDGKYVQSQISIEDESCPVKKNIPRINVMKGTGFILEPYQGNDSKTLAAFYFNMDLKGLPKFILSRVVSNYPLVISQIRNHMEGNDCYSTNPSYHCDLSSKSRDTLTGMESVRRSHHYHDPIPIDHYIK